MTIKNIIIVDGNDQVLGAKRKDSLSPEDIYRLSALWLTGPDGRVLLAQRSFNRKHSPGKWGPSAAGTVDEGESYDATVVREIKEEIGLDIPLESLRRGPKIRIRRPERPDYFGQWYFHTLAEAPAEFQVSEREVQQVRWMTKEDLLREVMERPGDFVASIPQWLPQILLSE